MPGGKIPPEIPHHRLEARQNPSQPRPVDDSARPFPQRNPRITGNRRRLTPAQRHEILRRHQEGEKTALLAAEFGVSRQAVDQLVKYHLDPESRVRKQTLRSRMLPEERAMLVELLRTTVPRDHGVELEGSGHPEVWNGDRAMALGKKLFGKKLYTYAVRDCIQEARPNPRFDPDAKPEPPKPPDIRDLDPELAADEDFVKYYFSPISQQIRQKEYEWALREWEERQARKAAGQSEQPPRKRGRPMKSPEPPPGLDDGSPEPFDGNTPLHGGDATPLGYHPPGPGQRRGKHAGSKGSPFTKPKRKKKKR